MKLKYPEGLKKLRDPGGFFMQKIFMVDTFLRPDRDSQTETETRAREHETQTRRDETGRETERQTATERETATKRETETESQRVRDEERHMCESQRAIKRSVRRGQRTRGKRAKNRSSPGIPSQSPIEVLVGPNGA